MIFYLKAKKYKGIKEVILNDLGHINVLCGKNNSGKTSILEALNTEDNTALGKKINSDSEKWINAFFAKKTGSLATPDPQIAQRWFKKYISKLIENKTVWFNDDKDKI